MKSGSYTIQHVFKCILHSCSALVCKYEVQAHACHNAPVLPFRELLNFSLSIHFDILAIYLENNFEKPFNNKTLF